MLFNRLAGPSSSPMQTSNTKIFPAPRRGLIQNDSLAMPQGEGAEVMDNWFPTPQGARMRRGSVKKATTGTSDIRTFMAYETGGVKKLFAATPTAVFDVTTPANPDTVLSPVLSGLGGGKWSSVMFSNSAGASSLIAVNGANALKRFDGTSWSDITGTSTPVSITGVDTSKLSAVWAYQNRLFFVQGGTASAWYLPTLSYGGAAKEIPMGSTFTKGGVLLFGGTWSTDSGSGMDDMCVFVTDMGEVAVFQGTDPDSINTWSKVGTYVIGKPLGNNAFFKTGGDIAIITDDGIVSVSQIMQKDRAGLASVAITFPIETLWRDVVFSRAFAGYDFSAVVWPTESLLMVVVPAFAGSARFCLVANAKTGAWCRYTGWDARCAIVFDDKLFFGTSDGRVVQGETSGAECGEPYAAALLPRFDDMASPTQKVALHARCIARSNNAFEPILFANADYETDIPDAGISYGDASGNVWGGAVWDSSTWGATESKKFLTEWQSVAAVGSALSAGIVMTSGRIAPPDLELIAIHLQYEAGNIL
ncbi:hypothetical protein [Ochrobactrum sp. MYb379]|uniref:hypothetical protein n=1 Tax=Ochrobactrum sp. MYb379 TaxID=2745275 RepID=UPI0030A19399